MFEAIIKSITVVLLLTCISISDGKKPRASYIKPCSKSAPDFDECCLAHGKEALPYIVRGDKEYKLPNMTPLIIPSVFLDNGGLKITINDLHLHGLDNSELKQVKFDFDKKNVIIKLYFDKLELLGDYEFDGKLLLLQLHGSGKSNITTVGVDIEYNVNYKFDIIEGEEYFTVDTAKSDFACKKAYIDLTNIFGDNKLLADSTNKALNDNWSEFFESVKPMITDTVTEVCNSIINAFASTVPFADIFFD